MTGQDKDSDPLGIPHERKEPRPDFSKPLPPTKLPKAIEDTLNNEEKLLDALYEGEGPDSTDSNVRYAAYASRFRTILLSAHRYVAYTSDIGESFRPIAHPWLVRSAYAVSWLYLVGDVSNEGYKAYTRNQKALFPELPRSDDQAPTFPQAAHSAVGNPGQKATTTKDVAPPMRVAPIDDYRTVMAQRAIFQSVASMGLPAFTIHSIVKYAGKALKDAKNKTIRTWMPIGLGIAAVPFLPFVFDKPVEEAVEWTFHKGFELVGGKRAVTSRPEKKEL